MQFLKNAGTMCLNLCCDMEHEKVSTHDDGENTKIRNAEDSGKKGEMYRTFSSGPDQQDISRHPEIFEKAYVMKELIGYGSSSKCYRCVRRRDEKVFAVKVINFSSLSMRYGNKALRKLFREVQTLQVLKHDSIIHMEEYFATGDKLYIIEEFLHGGELYDKVLEKQGLTEQQAKIVFAQLASAINHMHLKNIMHRDIKPENVLLTNPTSLKVKIIDFGFSRTIKGTHASSFLGTGGFLAPELRLGIRRGTKEEPPMYTKAVDVWALGCLLYVVIAAVMPFDDTLYYRPANSFELRFRPERKWRHISPQCKDLLRGMLQPEPLRRFTIHEVLRHRWLSDVVVAKPKKIARAPIMNLELYDTDNDTASTRTISTSPHHSQMHDDDFIPLTSRKGTAEMKLSCDQQDEEDELNAISIH